MPQTQGADPTVISLDSVAQMLHVTAEKNRGESSLQQAAATVESQRSLVDTPVSDFAFNLDKLLMRPK